MKRAPLSRKRQADGSRRHAAIVCAALVVMTAAVYAQVTGFGFLNYDDDVYVTINPHITDGLTLKSVLWSFSFTYQAANWHPLTWLSLLVDYDMSGLDSGAFHLTNLVLHLAAALLLFAVLNRLTRRVYPSAFVAALFALHPLHVQSVAWIAERKDVLSAVFWMLSMLAYAYYVESPTVRRYLLTLAAFACGLLAKPMLVSLPLVLLLLDYWPLGRLGRQKTAANGSPLALGKLIAEKIPFVVLGIASSVVTMLAQRMAGATETGEAFSVGLRLANAAVSYVAYLVKTVAPLKLAVFYPHPRTSLPVWQVVGSVVILAVVTYAVLRAARSRGYLVVGWLWYLITLVPMIGIVQVGSQAMADRYTYIPLIGIFVIVAWGVPDLLRLNVGATSASRAVPLAVLAGAVLVTLMAVTYVNVGYWRSSVTLFEHAIGVTGPNPVAHDNLGAALMNTGQMEAAVRHFREALRIEPKFVNPRYNLASALVLARNLRAAVPELRRVVELAPNHVKAQTDLGAVLAQLGRYDQAIPHLRKAIALSHDNHIAHNNLGLIYLRSGKIGPAIDHLSIAVRLKPDNADYWAALDQARSLR